MDAKPAQVLEDVTRYLDSQPKGSSVSTNKDELHVSNKLMQMRVLMQAVALVVLAILMMMASNR